MRRLLLILLFFTASLNAQIQVTGIIKDASSKKIMPFATLTIVETQRSYIADIDGKFLLNLAPNQSFTVSFVGYRTETFTIEDKPRVFTVYLAEKPEVLQEIIISHNESEALDIIKKTIHLKNQNNPEKQLRTFQFKSYNKLIVTASPDSIEGRIKTKVNSKGKVTRDSSEYKLKRLLRNQHLFQTEKVSVFQFKDANLKETVLGTKMSGFKIPVYEVIAFNLQSFSIYDNQYELFETQYKSPIALTALLDYEYKLIDTTYLQNRKVFMVYFKRKKTNAGLEGILYIDAENNAVAKMITRIRSVIDIAAFHNFTFIEKEKLWFPSSKEFKIIKGKNNDDIRFLGGTIHFEGDYEELGSNREKDATDFTSLTSKTLYYDYGFNIPLKINHSSITLEIPDDAIQKDEFFWKKHRKEPLDERGEATYTAMDSILAKEKVESKLRFGRKIFNGYLPVSFFDFDLRYLLSYNNYEGFRIGLGGITNEKFSTKHRIETYTAYGTKDGNFKYNLGGAVRIGKFSNTWLGASYTDDVREIASTSFLIDKRVFKIYDPRPINVSTFYNHQSWRGFLETKFIPKTESIWQLSHSRVAPQFGYIYYTNNRLYNTYRMTMTQVSIQWNPFSDFMQTPSGRMESEKRFPKFTFQYTQSLAKFIESDFEFSKLDFRGEYEKKYLNGHRTSVLLQAGIALGDVPLTHLYSSSPNSLNKEHLLERITVAGKNSFETMYFNEFFSSKYAMLQLKHGLKRIKIFKKVNPSFVLVTRMAWGDINHPEKHVGLDYKTLNDGYVESGLELNQIFKGFGLSGFYRYGPNQLPKFTDNISLKISFMLDLGF
jgi:hypothetical protein